MRLRFLTTSTSTFYDWLEAYEREHCPGQQVARRDYDNGTAWLDSYGVPIAHRTTHAGSGHDTYHVYALPKDLA